MVQLGEVCDILIGRTPRRDSPAFWNGSQPWVTISDMRDEVITHTNERISHAGVSDSGSRILRAGTLLFSFKLTIGKTAFAGVDLFTNEAIAGILPKRTDTIDTAYLRYALMGTDTAKGSSHAVKGKTLNLELIRQIEIPLPPLAEQRRVAGLLKAQLAAVEKARKAAAERVEAAGAMDSAVLREIYADAANGSWPMKELSEVSSIASGIQKQPDRAPRNFHRPFLTVRNVQRGRLDLSQTERFEITPAELDRLRLQDEDILIVEGNGSVDHIGRNALFHANGEEWIHQNHIIRVRLDRKRTMPRFISYYLNSAEGAEQMVEKARTSSGLYTLSSGKVATLDVPIPPIKKQEEVIERVEAMMEHTFKVKTAATAELSALEALPGRLLGEVFG